MNNRKKIIPSLETDFLMKEYIELIEIKYNFYSQVVDFSIFHSLILAGKYLCYPGIEILFEQLDLEKKWRKAFYYFSHSPRFQNTVEYIQFHASDFITQNCPNFSNYEVINASVDTFIECLMQTVMILNGYGSLGSSYDLSINKLKSQLKTDLKKILGKLAWFSLEQPELIALDPEFQKFFPYLIDYDMFHRLIDDFSLEELVINFQSLSLEMYNYNVDLERRNRFNVRHLEGWTANIDKKMSFLYDKTAVDEVRKSYKNFVFPLGHILGLTLLGMKCILYKYFIFNRYVGPKINEYKEAEINKWMKKKDNLHTNKKLLAELRDVTAAQQLKTKWAQRIIFASLAINSLSNIYYASNFLGNLALEITSTLSTYLMTGFDEKNRQDSNPFYWSFVYEFIIYLYATYTLINLFYKFFSTPSLDKSLEKYQALLNNALEKISYDKVKMYKNTTINNNYFFLHIKDYKRLSVEKLDNVLKQVFNQYGLYVQCSEIDSIQHKKIILKINGQPNLTALGLTIDQALKFANQVEKMKEQLRSLTQCLNLTGQIGSILKENHDVIGELLFSFMKTDDTLEWEMFFLRHLAIKNIIYKEYQLQLRIKLLKEEKFTCMLKEISKHKKELQLEKKLITDPINLTSQNQIMTADHSSELMQKIVQQNNKKAAKIKRQLKIKKIQQKKEIAEQQAIANQQRKNAASKEETTITPDLPTIYYFKINDGNQYTYPPLIKFNSELEEKAFKCDSRIYNHFFNRAKNGFIKNVKDTIHNSKKIKIKDYETGTTSTPTGAPLIPTHKIKGYGRLFKDIRAWAITKKEIINGNEHDVYDVRSVSFGSHRE